MSTADPSKWALPRLTVNREGEWLHEGQEITHPGILANLMRSLRRDADGYFIQAGRVRVPVEVADVPFVVVRVVAAESVLRLTVNDGTSEPLDPATLRLTAAGIPYCRIKGGQFEARLSRAATYQLGGLIDYDEATGTAVLKVGDRTYRVSRE
jgi:uncharacterized protein